MTPNAHVSNRDTPMLDSLLSLPSCETVRLELRPLMPPDSAVLRTLTDDPAIIAVIPFLSQPFTAADARHLIGKNRTGRDCFFGAWRKGGGSLVAVVGAHLRGGAEIEIGYWVGSRFHGKGYGTEAAGAVIALVARHMPTRRIVAECRPENAASWRVLEKLDFRPTGADGTRPGRKLLALSRE